ncbi:ubiquitin-like small modifier protein 1 [Natronorubrum sp. A-ect3]|uniref:ubiquitin-like small modifier protein 1 n=1 Tax=Natronorubrum sp. A-ect3 TaxID=3242698 RepID=UPI00359EE2D4
MQLECVFFGPFRDVTGEKIVIHETDAETVGELLVELETAYPALEGQLVDEDEGELVGKTVVTKNKRNVTHIDGLETALDSTDVIRLVPSVYGG